MLSQKPIRNGGASGSAVAITPRDVRLSHHKNNIDFVFLEKHHKIGECVPRCGGLFTPLYSPRRVGVWCDFFCSHGHTGDRGASSVVYAGTYKEYLSDDDNDDDESEDRMLIPQHNDARSTSSYGALSIVGGEEPAAESARLSSKRGSGRSRGSHQRRCIVHSVRMGLFLERRGE